MGPSSAQCAIARSDQAPSWVQVFASVLEWSTALRVVATVFLSQLAKNAADDLWKNKGAIAALLRECSAAPLKHLAGALIRARSKLRKDSKAVVGIPIPDDFFGAGLDVPADSLEDTAVALAVFVVHLEAIETFVQNEIMRGDGVVSRVRIHLLPNGGIRLRWMDRKNLEEHDHDFLPVALENPPDST